MVIIDGEEIKRLREKAHLTQTELARLVGVSQAHIAKIEHNKVDPRLSTINKIIDVLKSKNDITCEEVMTKNVITIQSTRQVSEACRLMQNYGISQLPVVQKGKVVGVITESSIVKHIRRGIEKEKVLSVMEPPLPIINEKTKIDSIKPLLENYGAVLISDGNKIKGIVTKSDLFKLIGR
ncbi:MAG: CBS domain-containing protein [Candidatus Parvarchaeota archaeon]|nr:CBS domain-containing protein [Candidatus Jingweiarchaeum tengchongense]MCW1298400.1 CBS domain-containing protein [Candidatus Jingweiarchaeum tengchongense]MCW1300298.1 CBS domain-containing protein [Candidatus Jingweiarchaeum tengchongense]MCW1304906.1 CBS domain-containing protein [Candidatus Jingweiarchaeum tengchongense]MCW1305794.1 CBS domain-containing protein [Candidatus Jingweiarchaeum tengchongense]